MPSSRSSRGRATLRRRRLLASGALAASVVLNVWAVAMAGDQPGSADGASRPTAAATSRAAAAPGTAVVQRGDGRFTVLPLPGASPAPAPTTSAPASVTPRATAPATDKKAKVVRYTVETEGGLGADSGELARVVSAVLTDPRGWQAQDGVRFVNVTPSEAARGAAVDVRVSLASPDTTDRLCAPLETRGEVSCHNGGRAVLNLRRWMLGVEAYGTDLTAYRTYLVNHEVGHALGHGHVSCPAPGKDAPVMMQQTYGLDGCAPWPWPTPRA